MSHPIAADDVHQAVREHYGKAACGGSQAQADAHAGHIGYDADALEELPDGANLGLGCGNPTALAALEPGQTVVDLGAGGGLDALLAAKRVGSTGRVIGVDMTSEMLERARTNAVEAGVAGFVEFREGTIEALPIVADTVDVVISNCVINLSPDKPQVFREAHRVLKPGGKLAVSDILLTAELPPEIAGMAAAYTGCVGGAMLVDDYVQAMRDAGFTDIETKAKPLGGMLDTAADDPMIRQAIELLGADQVKAVAQTVFSYDITASKRSASRAERGTSGSPTSAGQRVTASGPPAREAQPAKK